MCPSAKIKYVAVIISCLFCSFVLAAEKSEQALPFEPSRTGWLRVKLPELPVPEVKPSWLPYDFKAEEEAFEIYIPREYDPKNSYGVMAWVNWSDDPETPRHFEPLLNEYKLISVAAERAGNGREPARRIGLLVSAILQLSKTLNIDKTRLIMSGYSGGGRTSAMGCFVHPEFWRGAISWVGGNFYKQYSVPMPVGASSPGINDWIPNAVTPQNVKDAKKNEKFVLITGSKDKNLNDSRGIYRALKREDFQALLIEEPGLGHDVGSAESMRKALEFMFPEIDTQKKSQ